MAKKQHAGVSEQHKASIHRWVDAQALLKATRWRGAMYLAGYVVECQLKSKLMARLRCRTLQQLETELQHRGIGATPFTHNLGSLLALTGSQDRLRQNSVVWRSFKLVNQWVPAWRYSPDLAGEVEATTFLNAVQEVNHWLDVNL